MPTTISRSRNSNLITALLAVGVGAAFGWGCSDPAKPEQCQEDTNPPSIPAPPDSAMLRARVSIESLVSIDAAGVSTVTNSIIADLVDTTSAVSTPRTPSMVGSPGCYGLTGNPTTICRPGVAPPCTVEKLDADKIEVSGLAGGATITLDRTAKGAFSKEQLPSPLFGTGPLTVTITGREEAGFFPSMTAQVPQPELLVLEEPAQNQPAKALGPGDIKIRWTPGQSDLIALQVSPSPPRAGADDLQCVLSDDGCTTLYQGDLDAYDMPLGSKIQLDMIRDDTRIVTDGSASLEAKAVSRMQLVLSR